MRILVLAGIGAITLHDAADDHDLRGPGDRRHQLLADDPRLSATAPAATSSAATTSGSTAGLVAGAALLIDYTLTVAVSVSAAVAAVTSVIPELFPERVLMAVGIVVLLMLGNLRGVRESGTIFMAPTYLYIVAILAMVGIGLVRLATGTMPDYAPPAEWLTAEAGGEALGILLILRAFSSGAAALTGVEAISDGVPAFKPPEWRNARITLLWAAGDLRGRSSLASASWPAPSASCPTRPRSRRSCRRSRGRWWGMAPSSSSSRSPRCSSWPWRRTPPLPTSRGSLVPGARQLHAPPVRVPRRAAGVHDRDRRAVRPRRPAAGGLRRERHRASSRSTRSACSSRSRSPSRAWSGAGGSAASAGWRRGLVINGVGAVTTGVIALIVVESKFLSGAWMVVIADPVARDADARHPRPLPSRSIAAWPSPASRRAAVRRAPIVIVPIARLDEPARQAIAFANAISRRGNGRPRHQ